MKYKQYNILFLIFVTFSCTLTAQQFLQPQNEIDCAMKKYEEYNNFNEFQKDFLIYMELLQNTHPLSFSRIDKNEMIISEFLVELGECKSLIDFEIILQRIAAQYKDSHTYIEPHKNDTIYPIRVKFFGNECYIVKIDKKNSDCVGKQIESINNIPMSAIADTFANVFGCENKIKLNIIVAYFISNIDYIQRLGIVNTDYTIRTKDGYLVDLIPKKMDEVIWSEEDSITFHPVTTEDRTKYFFYKIFEDYGICYFQFNKFYDRATYSYFVSEQLSIMQQVFMKKDIHKNAIQLPCFSEFLEQMFAEMDERNIEILVVDLRNNGGGNSVLGEQLLSCLHESKDMNNRIKVSLRISSFYKQHYKKTSKQLERIYKKKFNVELKDSVYSSSAFVSEQMVDNSITSHFANPKIKNPFTGKVIFIQGSHSFSSAVDLLTEIHDNKLYVTIGEETSQKPTSYGDILYFELPNTKIRGGISCKIFQRPDSTLNDVPTLTPNVEIINSYTDCKNGIDRIWDYIILNYSVKNEK